MKSTSPRSSVAIQQPIATPSKATAESISDDEKSEKRYSSSGYYESPHDDGKFQYLYLKQIYLTDFTVY